MAMAVSRRPNDWLKIKNPPRMQAFARCWFREKPAEKQASRSPAMTPGREPYSASMVVT